MQHEQAAGLARRRALAEYWCAHAPKPIAPRRSEKEKSLSEWGLIIFDCDGTLVDSEEISTEVLADSLSESGLATTTAEAGREYQGLLLTEIDARAQAKLGRPLPGGWLERFEHERAERFRRELRPVAGAAETLRAIKAAGIAVCVASQGKLEKTRLTLELTGLRELFAEQQLFSAWSVARGKPHPDLFLHAADMMGVEPNDCVVVEDSTSGIEAARAARMHVVGYAPQGSAGLLRAGANELVSSLYELPARLGLAAI
jgi:HAD superfamily hydrolase (TIGR01509 family)